MRPDARRTRVPPRKRTHIATLEELIPSEDARRLRGSGFLMERLREVKMAHPDDQTRYRLAVCLVPVK